MIGCARDPLRLEALGAWPQRLAESWAAAARIGARLDLDVGALDWMQPPRLSALLEAGVAWGALARMTGGAVATASQPEPPLPAPRPAAGRAIPPRGRRGGSAATAGGPPPVARDSVQAAAPARLQPVPPPARSPVARAAATAALRTWLAARDPIAAAALDAPVSIGVEQTVAPAAAVTTDAVAGEAPGRGPATPRAEDGSPSPASALGPAASRSRVVFTPDGGADPRALASAPPAGTFPDAARPASIERGARAGGGPLRRFAAAAAARPRPDGRALGETAGEARAELPPPSEGPVPVPALRAAGSASPAARAHQAWPLPGDPALAHWDQRTLATQLERLLRHEARRAGIDLSETET